VVFITAMILGCVLWRLAATRLGFSDATVDAQLRLVQTFVKVMTWAFTARVVLSFVKNVWDGLTERRSGTTPSARLVTSSWTSAPWRRPQVLTNAERFAASTVLWPLLIAAAAVLVTRANLVVTIVGTLAVAAYAAALHQVRRRTSQTHREVIAELEALHDEDPHAAEEAWRDWARARGADVVPVVTRFGVAGLAVKTVWSQAFSHPLLAWTHPLLCGSGRWMGLTRLAHAMTEWLMVPVRTLTTKLAIVTRPWGGIHARGWLRHGEPAPRDAFVVDLAPMLVFAALWACSLSAAVARTGLVV
jgi:hypothetical protein